MENCGIFIQRDTIQNKIVLTLQFLKSKNNQNKVEKQRNKNDFS